MQSNMAILRNSSVQNACDDLSFFKRVTTFTCFEVHRIVRDMFSKKL